MHAHIDKLKIVVADDSPFFRRLVEDAFAGEEFTLLFARNGREAVGLVSAHEPAIVVTDWEMPDVTGLELCEQIRRENHALHVHHSAYQQHQQRSAHTEPRRGRR